MASTVSSFEIGAPHVSTGKFGNGNVVAVE
jgi:hypothetical protein